MIPDDHPAQAAADNEDAAIDSVEAIKARTAANARHNLAVLARRGRPPLPKGKARTLRIEIRLSPAERATIEANAKAAGLSVTEWMRRRAL